MPLGYWLTIYFKKILTLLLWEIKKVIKTLIVFFFPIKTFFNWIFNQYPKVAFGTRESTLLLASRFLRMWFLAIWMPKNVAIPLFGFIGNILIFLEMWDDNVWFILRNFEWIIYFSHSILRFECKLPNPLKKKSSYK